MEGLRVNNELHVVYTKVIHLIISIFEFVYFCVK